MAHYISFPHRETILARLKAMEGSTATRREFYREIADHLDCRTLDEAAFAFLLIEIVRRYEGTLGEARSSFVPRCVLALTQDQELAMSAWESMHELERGALEPEKKVARGKEETPRRFGDGKKGVEARSG